MGWKIMRRVEIVEDFGIWSAWSFMTLSCKKWCTWDSEMSTGKTITFHTLNLSSQKIIEKEGLFFLAVWWTNMEMNMCEFQQRFKKDNTIICNIPSRIYIRGGFPLPCSVYGGTRIQIHVQPQCCGFRCSEACTAAPAPSQANHLVRAIEYTSSDDAVRLPSVCPWWKDVKNLTVFFSTSKQPLGDLRSWGPRWANIWSSQWHFTEICSLKLTEAQLHRGLPPRSHGPRGRLSSVSPALIGCLAQAARRPRRPRPRWRLPRIVPRMWR